MHVLALFLSKSLYNTPLAKHNIIPHGHKPVLYICPQSMHEIYAPVKEILEQCLLDVSPISKDISVKFLGEKRLSLSSTFAPVKQNVMISPLSSHIRCSLNPRHQPMPPYRL